MSSKRDRNESDEVKMRRWLNRAEREVLPMVKRSAATISINPEHPDAKIAVELGFTLLLDKPLVIVSFSGRNIPEHLRKAADLVIVTEDPSDPEVGRQIHEFLDSLPEKKGDD